MIGKKYIELINKEIDGIISPEEQEQLQAYLQENPEAQKLYRELIRTAGMLNQIEEIEPSIHLKKRIMNAVGFHKHTPPQHKVIPGIKWFTKPGYILAFVSGVFIGLLVYALLPDTITQKSATDNTGMSGAIGIHGKNEIGESKKVSVMLPEIKGTLSLKQFDENLVELETNLASPYECEIVLQFDPAQIRFDVVPLQGRFAVLESGEHYVKIKSSGKIQYNIFFTRISSNSAPLGVKLFVSGTERYSHQFMIDSQ